MSTKPLSGSEAAGNSPAASGSAHPEVALTVKGLNKQFGGTKALDEAHLTVRKGTVHALLGGNGSGKSTTIKILAGVYSADSGELNILGKDYSLNGYTSTTAQSAGIRFVHQDLGLFDDLSIEENFALDAGYPTGFGGHVKWHELRERVAKLMEEYEIYVDPRTPVGDLRPSDRTMVAIARALQDQGDEELILVLDEPTASLALHESSLLLEKVRKRADLGQTVIIVSHRLQEVISVAHDFTIYRDGKVVGVLTDAKPTEDELVEIMAGSAVQALRPTGSVGHGTEEVILELKNLRVGPIHGVNLKVHRGEIVGIAGLVGSGRSTILKSVFGAIGAASGEILFKGKPLGAAHIDIAMDAGIAMVPEDRGHDAAFAELTVSDNLAVSVLRENWGTKWMPRAKERLAALGLIDRFRIKVAGPDALFSSMSGGNQQKVILARWLQRKPELLLLDEPSQGVDVMSRVDIYELIREAAESGCSVLVASSDMSELHALCDRIVLLRSGRIIDEVNAYEETVDSLTRLVLVDPTGQTHAVETPITSRSAR